MSNETGSNWRDRFPIGSRWKTPTGNCAEVVEHAGDDAEWPLVVLIESNRRFESGRYALDRSGVFIDLMFPNFRPCESATIRLAEPWGGYDA